MAYIVNKEKTYEQAYTDIANRIPNCTKRRVLDGTIYAIMRVGGIELYDTYRYRQTRESQYEDIERRQMNEYRDRARSSDQYALNKFKGSRSTAG